ncbi:MAG TPA: VOC family protein [Gammaproteobacteria bacterium]|nr:VOC family protein [Gammaproteobacteria bacterium]
MPIRGFDHYNLRAPRALLDELRDFYRDVVGLTVGERPPFRRFGYWLYAGTRPVLHLSEADAQEHRSRNVLTTFAHAAFECTDRAEFERRLEERGIRYRVDRVPLTNQVQLFFQDPAGNGVELQFDAPDGA